MIQIYVVLSSLAAGPRARVEATLLRRDDRGSVSHVQVIVSLGVFLFAVAVAGISAAVIGRLGRIK